MSKEEDNKEKLVGSSDEKKDDGSPQNNKFAMFLMIVFVVGTVVGGSAYIYRTFLRLNHIEVIIADNYDEMSKKAADIIAKLVKKKPNATLGLATGSTPLGLYKELIEKYKKGELSFRGVTTYNLDEYCGLTDTDPQSYHYYMKHNFFKHINIDYKKTHVPHGEGNSEESYKLYEQRLKKTKIDLQLLGIGGNGHIGFNEPGTPFNSGVHVTKLSRETIRDNARFFNNNMNKVPKMAITMGIGNILDAESILLVANGPKKAEAIRELMSGDIDINVPASALNLFEGKVYVVIDKEAAALL